MKIILKFTFEMLGIIILFLIIITFSHQALDSIEKEMDKSGIGQGAVLIVPSPSFIPTSDITTESVLPLGTLTGQNLWL